MHLYSALPTLSLLLSTAASQYTLEDDYSPAAFASMFAFFTGDDPTHGYVNYLSQSAGEAAGLYTSDGSSVTLGVDSTNVATGRGRDSVRVESLKRYNSGLFILDAAHMPEGCGTWPAFWLYGPNWPSGGEIDIIEGVNTQSANSFAAHTGPGCSITNNGFSGSMSTPNCDVNAPGQGTNVGCAITTSDTRSYGSGFNANNGGVYATEWTSEAISIWFFPRGSIPSDITSNTPSPANWGFPSAKFAAPCDIDQHFSDQRIVLNTALCGDWAGAVWDTDSTCASKGATCQEFVQNNPTAFQNAHWTINSLKVYQQGGVASTSATATTLAPTTPATIALSSTAQSSFPATTVASSISTTFVSISTPVAPPPFTQTSIIPTTSLPATSETSTSTPVLPSTFLTSTVSIPLPTTSFTTPATIPSIPLPTTETPNWTSTWSDTPTDAPSWPQGQGWGGSGGHDGYGGGGGRWGGPPGRRVRL